MIRSPLSIRTKMKTFIIYHGVRLYQVTNEFVVHMSVSKADILCPCMSTVEYVHNRSTK
jgi:hypothetical protein